MRSVIDNFTAYLYSIVLWAIHDILTPQSPTNFFPNLHPSIFAWTTHGLPLITSPSEVTTVLIRRNAPTDSCHNLTALMHAVQNIISTHSTLHMCSQKFRQSAYYSFYRVLFGRAGNGGRTPYCGLTSTMGMRRHKIITQNATTEAHSQRPAANFAHAGNV